MSAKAKRTSLPATSIGSSRKPKAPCTGMSTVPSNPPSPSATNTKIKGNGCPGISTTPCHVPTRAEESSAPAATAVPGPTGTNSTVAIARTKKAVKRALFPSTARIATIPPPSPTCSFNHVHLTFLRSLGTPVVRAPGLITGTVRASCTDRRRFLAVHHGKHGRGEQALAPSRRWTVMHDLTDGTVHRLHQLVKFVVRQPTRGRAVT